MDLTYCSDADISDMQWKHNQKCMLGSLNTALESPVSVVILLASCLYINQNICAILSHRNYTSITNESLTNPGGCFHQMHCHFLEPQPHSMKPEKQWSPNEGNQKTQPSQARVLRSGDSCQSNPGWSWDKVFVATSAFQHLLQLPSLACAHCVIHQIYECIVLKL